MKLIAGLGNPGRLYRYSRHNIGFLAVNALARLYKVALKNDRGTFALSGEGKIAGRKVMLAMPLTFMNLSGVAVGALLKKHGISLDDLLVVCDDLDLEFTRFKAGSRGSSGGHRGLRSIIDYVGSQGFCRLRIGIGRPPEDASPAEYVLSPFLGKDKEKIRYIIERSCDFCRMWVREGITPSMGIFNRWSK